MIEHCPHIDYGWCVECQERLNPIVERYALEMSKKDTEIERLKDLRITTFLGWPTSMWYEIQDYLKQNAAKDESPLATLSRLTK